MRNLLFIAILLVTSDMMAQTAGFKPVSDMLEFHQEFRIKSAELKTIASDFKQEKELAALSEKITSTGKFWFRRSNQVRIDYEAPFAYRLIMNGDQILLKDQQKENRLNIKSNKLFQQVNRIILDCIQGSILDSKDFTTLVFENENSFLLQMTPASKSLKEFFETISLYVDKRDYSADKIIMSEPGGDTTVMTFGKKKVNQPISDETFAL